MKFNKLTKDEKVLIYYLLIRDFEIGLTENLPNNVVVMLKAVIKELNTSLKRWGFKKLDKVVWDKDLDIPLLNKLHMSREEVVKFYDSFDRDCSKFSGLFVK